MGSELIEYTGILHGSGVGSRAAADFRMRLSGDPDFLRRAAVIDRLFLLRDNLGDHRRAWPTPRPSHPLRQLLAGLLRRVRRG